MNSISKYTDILDVRDITDRVEDLEHQLDNFLEKHNLDDWNGTPEQEELTSLYALLDELKGQGGDLYWRNCWYPSVLVESNHFEAYAQELAEDIGAVDKNASWPNNCIDWSLAAYELQQDYTAVGFHEATYWYR